MTRIRHNPIQACIWRTSTRSYPIFIRSVLSRSYLTREEPSRKRHNPARGRASGLPCPGFPRSQSPGRPSSRQRGPDDTSVAQQDRVVYRVYLGGCTRAVQGRVHTPGRVAQGTPRFLKKVTIPDPSFGPSSGPVLDPDIRRFMGLLEYSWSRSGCPRMTLFLGRNSTF